MGKKIEQQRLAFVTIGPAGSQYAARMAIEGLLSCEEDPRAVLERGSAKYLKHIEAMRRLLERIQDHRAQHTPTPARLVWQVGDAVFSLSHDLLHLRLQLDDTYAHLVRDLRVRRKWLEKAVILRRYLPSQSHIPPRLPWGALEKGTRRKAMCLLSGQPPK